MLMSWPWLYRLPENKDATVPPVIDARLDPVAPALLEFEIR